MGSRNIGRSFGSRVGRFLFRLTKGTALQSEYDPIGRDEWLLRRVPAKSNYHNPKLTPAFQRACFVPNENDTDGISLFREMFLSPRSLSKIGRKPPYIVARVKASVFIDGAMTLNSTPDPAEPPGHVSIPEISIARYKTNKHDTRELQMLLVDASELAFDPTPHSVTSMAAVLSATLVYPLAVTQPALGAEIVL